jgi:hypothetical protein
MGGQPFRKSPRLAGFDYSTAGTYFITVCTQNMEIRFGTILNGALQSNDAGDMVGEI